MANLENILAFNRAFVAEKKYEDYQTSKYPSKKMAVLSCMDTRLTELLPAALNLKNGDTKIIKHAGAVISHPFGSVMRSLLIAIYDLGIEDILVIGHYDCGMQGLDTDSLLHKMEARGISGEKLEMIGYCGVDLHRWLKGFEDARTSVEETVNLIKTHPLVPRDIAVYGFMMDPETGALHSV